MSEEGLKFWVYSAVKSGLPGLLAGLGLFWRWKWRRLIARRIERRLRRPLDTSFLARPRRTRKKTQKSRKSRWNRPTQRRTNWRYSRVVKLSDISGSFKNKYKVLSQLSNDVTLTSIGHQILFSYLKKWILGMKLGRPPESQVWAIMLREVKGRWSLFDQELNCRVKKKN